MHSSIRRIAAPCLLGLAIAASPATLAPTGAGLGLVPTTAAAGENVFERMSRSIGGLFGTEPARRSGTQRRAIPPVDPTALPRPRPADAAGSAVSAIGADAVRSAVRVGVAAAAADTTPAAPSAIDLVAVGLTADDLARLTGDGWTLLATRTSRLFEADVARLRPPRGLDLDGGLAHVRDLAPDALAAVNHTYALTPGTPCAGPTCGGGAAPTSCPAAVTIGVVGARPDLNLPGLDLSRIAILPTEDDAGRHPGSVLVEALVGSESVPARLSGVALVVRPLAARTDLDGILAALDDVAATGPDVVVIEAAGEPDPLLADAIARLAADDVPTVAAASIAPGGLSAGSDDLAATTVAVAAVRSARPYLNVGGLAAAVADRPALDRLCEQAGAVTLAGVIETSSRRE